MEVVRRTREERVKRNQMIALGFQTRGRYQTFPAPLRGSTKGRKTKERKRKLTKTGRNKPTYIAGNQNKIEQKQNKTRKNNKTRIVLKV